ncbi:hypothetical protein V6Z11_A11G138600 [Gossypium hirsutum]
MHPRRYGVRWHALALGVGHTEARTWSYGAEGAWRLGLLRRKQKLLGFCPDFFVFGL